MAQAWGERHAAGLDRVLETAQSERRLPSVSAAVWRRGEIVWQRAIGLADADSGAEAVPETQYRIGSITKTFTAVAVMRLIDQGRLNLDDPISDHLPDLGGPPMTIRRLLCHLSGLQREPPGAVWEDWRFPAREELLSQVAAAERVLPAGSHWHYSNLAFSLLGELVALLAGRSWQEEVKASLLDPLGLDQTTLSPGPTAASGYFVDPYQDRLHLMPAVDLLAIAPAGQLWSTARDLARWAAFLAKPTPDLLSPESAELMHTVQVMADPGWLLGWGLGLMLHRRGEGLFAGHDGGMPGFLASIVYSRTQSAGAAVLTNTGSGLAVSELAIELTCRSVELEPDLPARWRPGGAVPASIESLLGGWWSEGNLFKFSFHEGHLQATLESQGRKQPPAIFEEVDQDAFRTISGRERGEPLRVVRDEKGEAVKLYWATYPFTKEPRG